MPTTTTILATPKKKKITLHKACHIKPITNSHKHQLPLILKKIIMMIQVEIHKLNFHTRRRKPFWQRFRFRVDTTDHPPQIFNLTLYLSIFVFGLFGAARGIDEGTGMY